MNNLKKLKATPWLFLALTALVGAFFFMSTTIHRPLFALPFLVISAVFFQLHASSIKK